MGRMFVSCDMVSSQIRMPNSAWACRQGGADDVALTSLLTWRSARAKPCLPSSITMPSNVAAFTVSITSTSTTTWQQVKAVLYISDQQVVPAAEQPSLHKMPRQCPVQRGSQ